MRTMSAHDTLKHIYRAHCLFCGKGVRERGDLVNHIAACKVYLHYREDLTATKKERSEYVTKYEDALRLLKDAHEAISNLQSTIKTLEEDALKASVKKAKKGEQDPA